VNRPEFEAALARVRERMADLPPAAREGLEGMVQETIERHDGIVRNSLAATRALERLELAQERLVDSTRRLERLAAEAAGVLSRLRTPPPPATGTA
jgi:hypothetical protein